MRPSGQPSRSSSAGAGCCSPTLPWAIRLAARKHDQNPEPDRWNGIGESYTRLRKPPRSSRQRVKRLLRVPENLGHSSQSNRDITDPWWPVWSLSSELFTSHSRLSVEVKDVQHHVSAGVHQHDVAANHRVHTVWWRRRQTLLQIRGTRAHVGAHIIGQHVARA